MTNNSTTLIQKKLKHRKYLITVFILSFILIIILPVSIRIYVPIIYIFLTFFFYGILVLSFENKLADYLISRHSKELKELKISNSKIGFNRIQRQFYYKQKELENISPIVKDGLELAFFYGRLAMISFFSIIILFIFLILLFEFSK